jgi:excisionase family DNA binding protein
VKDDIHPHTAEATARIVAALLLLRMIEGARHMALDQLMTAVEAAEYLGIRPSTLRHWICDGKIEFVKYGNGLVRLKRSVLDRFVASCTIKAKARDARSKEPQLREGPGLGSGHESLAR